MGSCPPAPPPASRGRPHPPYWTAASGSHPPALEAALRQPKGPRCFLIAAICTAPPPDRLPSQARACGTSHISQHTPPCSPCRPPAFPAHLQPGRASPALPEDSSQWPNPPSHTQREKQVHTTQVPRDRRSRGWRQEQHSRGLPGSWAPAPGGNTRLGAPDPSPLPAPHASAGCPVWAHPCQPALRAWGPASEAA